MAPIFTEHAEWFLSTFWFRRRWFGGLFVDTEGSCRWDEGVETGDFTGNLPSDNLSLHFFIQEGHELSYIAFRRLFSLRVNDPPSAYIIWKSPNDFRRENSTIVVNILP